MEADVGEFRGSIRRHWASFTDLIVQNAYTLLTQHGQTWGRMSCDTQNENKASHETDSIKACSDRQGSADKKAVNPDSETPAG